MPSFFSLFRRGFASSRLGVDIGTTSVKVVEVRGGKQLPEISNYGILESTGHLLRANKVLQTSSLKIFEDEAVELLKLLLREMRPKSREAVASLPSFSAFMTVLDFPEMGNSDLEKTMAFQARQYIPLPISEVAIDWLKVGEFEDRRGVRRQQILLISVPQEQIRKYQKIFNAAGLRLDVLEIESLGLIRAVVGSDPTPTIIIDIGSRSTNIALAEKGQLKSSAQTDFAGSSLTQALATSLSINPVRAEELKKERGILSTGPSYELSTIMLPFLDAIMNEVKKAQFNYQSQFPDAPKMERVILSGGGANLLGIEKYFQKELELPTVKATPFSKFSYPATMEPLVSELNPHLSVALGLALREFP
ncbi:type IV pilus assembly protein PilM [Candidatus Parcubacteria bacterium]|nr:MAG: type IV pilus assembly protein PilM [Candidatus Parcubacteria bacterium]